MSTKTAPWYAFAEAGDTRLRCANCDRLIEPGRSLDHHPAICPACGVETVYLNWKGRTLQIVLPAAPPVLVQMIRLAQEHLDELEYVELICALEQLADGLAPSLLDRSSR